MNLKDFLCSIMLPFLYLYIQSILKDLYSSLLYYEGTLCSTPNTEQNPKNEYQFHPAVIKRKPVNETVHRLFHMMGTKGLEPLTPSTSRKCSPS